MTSFYGKQDDIRFQRRASRTLSLWVSGSRRCDLFLRSGRASLVSRKGWRMRNPQYASQPGSDDLEGSFLRRFYIKFKLLQNVEWPAIWYGTQGTLGVIWDKPLEEATAHGKTPFFVIKQVHRQEMILSTRETFEMFKFASGGRLPLRATFWRDSQFVFVWHFRDLVALCDPQQLPWPRDVARAGDDAKRMPESRLLAELDSKHSPQTAWVHPRRKAARFKRHVCITLSRWMTRGHRSDLFQQHINVGSTTTRPRCNDGYTNTTREIRRLRKQMLESQDGSISARDDWGWLLIQRFLISCSHVSALELHAGIYGDTGKFPRMWDDPLWQAERNGKAPLCIVKEAEMPELVLSTQNTFEEFNAAAHGQLQLRGAFWREKLFVHVWRLHDLVALCDPKLLLGLCHHRRVGT